MPTSIFSSESSVLTNKTDLKTDMSHSKSISSKTTKKQKIFGSDEFWFHIRNTNVGIQSVIDSLQPIFHILPTTNGTVNELIVELEKIKGVFTNLVSSNNNFRI